MALSASTPAADDSVAARLAASEKQLRYVVAALGVVLLVVIVKSAWLGDDFYIGLRAFDNLLNGHGLRWNVAERVQVFTDPFFLFIVTAFYAITGEAFITTIVVSIALSLAAVWVLVRSAASSQLAAAAGLTALISSRAFIDYSTSGLENPLNYLLVAVFFAVLFPAEMTRRTFRQLVLITALIGFNRLDLMLVVFPAMLYVTWTVYRQKTLNLWGILADGLIYSVPLWAWLVFSTIYYGYPFPNTYYAKLHTAIPKNEQLAQGFLYYFNAISFDPVTLVVIALGLIVAFSQRQVRFSLCATGVVLYLIYIVNIGGDFMTGRFFSVPLFVAVGLLMRMRFGAAVWIFFGLLWLGIGLLAPRPTLLYRENHAVNMKIDFGDGAAETIIDRRGIADERANYYPSLGLLTVLTHDNRIPRHGWVEWGSAARARGRQLVVFGTPGLYGYYAGPEVHVLDYYGLGDAFISKLPIVKSEKWRVGHYPRALPKGYVESWQTGRNLVERPAARELYEATTIIAQDPLFSARRWKEIFRMHTGAYNKHIRTLRESDRGSTPPTGPTSYRWPRPDAQMKARTPVVATVRAGWPQESDATGEFWWCHKDARIEFSLPPDHQNRSIVIPVYFFGKDVQLEFQLNGTTVAAERLAGEVDSHFVPMKLRAQPAPGSNVIEIVGSGEPVSPSSHDQRQLLFAIRAPHLD